MRRALEGAGARGVQVPDVLVCRVSADDLDIRFWGLLKSFWVQETVLELLPPCCPSTQQAAALLKDLVLYRCGWV